jgi:hypothetical protein
MSEDYLWNRTGEPDPETVRLEQLLGPLKYAGPALSHRSRLVKPARLWWLAAAAAVLVAGIVTVPLALRGPLTSWQSSDGRHVRAGQLIETGALHHAKIQSEDTGEVTIDPDSRLRLVAASDREQRFDLQRGTIHAYIWAPPGRFVVDTPSSKTIDLGCSYTLQVSTNGTGLLTVELGWVAFERNKVESFIPAGAACVTRPGRGPGTPYFVDAAEALTNALARFDTSGDPAALATALAASRKHDALSLWHLMIRTQGDQRAKVFDRFASLVTLPAEATREAVLRGDGKALDAAWNALDLGDTDWWRGWKRQW